MIQDISFYNKDPATAMRAPETVIASQTKTARFFPKKALNDLKTALAVPERQRSRFSITSISPFLKMGAVVATTTIGYVFAKITGFLPNRANSIGKTHSADAGVVLRNDQMTMQSEGHVLDNLDFGSHGPLSNFFRRERTVVSNFEEAGIERITLSNQEIVNVNAHIGRNISLQLKEIFEMDISSIDINLQGTDLPRWLSLKSAKIINDLSTYTLPGGARSIDVDEDHGKAYVSSGVDGKILNVFDIADPANPIHLAGIPTEVAGNVIAIGRNQANWPKAVFIDSRLGASTENLLGTHVEAIDIESLRKIGNYSRPENRGIGPLLVGILELSTDCFGMADTFKSIGLVYRSEKNNCGGTFLAYLLDYMVNGGVFDFFDNFVAIDIEDNWDANNRVSKIAGRTYHADRNGLKITQAIKQWELTGVSRSGDQGKYTFSLTARGDNERESETRIIQINVQNRPPEAPEIFEQRATVTEYFGFDMPRFIDLDGDSLDYSASDLPEWLHFDPNQLTFSGTPSRKDTNFRMPKEHFIKIRAFDGTESTITQFKLSVGGMSSEDILVTIGSPIISVLITLYGWTKKRGLLLNLCRRYMKDEETAIVGQEYKHHVDENTKSVIAYVDDRRWLANFIRYFGIKMQRSLESGQHLPGWMNYYDDRDMVVGIPNKKGRYTIKVMGKAEIIREQFTLKVIEGSDDKKGDEDEEKEASVELQQTRIAITPAIKVNGEHDQQRHARNHFQRQSAGL